MHIFSVKQKLFAVFYFHFFFAHEFFTLAFFARAFYTRALDLHQDFFLHRMIRNPGAHSKMTAFSGTGNSGEALAHT